MLKRHLAILATSFLTLGAAVPAMAEAENKIVGTWRMLSAQINPDGENRPAYGPNPHGWLVFTKELTFVEVLTDPRVPKFASNVRGNGTDEENRAAMAGGIGFFGTYTVDSNGQFSGNRVEGSTFPNWIGSMRTTEQLQIVVDGDRMTENFRRPEGAHVRITWERIK
jgi:hypothetical protein